MNAMNVLTNVRWWILVAAIIGLILGDIGGEHDGIILTVFLMIMMCFSLTKLNFSKGELAQYRKKVIIAIFLCSIVSTAITLCIGLFYDHSIWAGWVILSCVPCAISVVSATLLMGGDMKLITLSITVVYIIAIGLTPLLVYALVGDAVNPLEILKYVILFILIPFIVSRPLGKLGISKDWNTIIINISFFVFAVIGFGRSKELFFDNTQLAVLVVLGTFIRIAAAHLIFEFISRRAGVCKNDRIPYSLLLIWRNSGFALTLTMILFPGGSDILAPAIISMVFEQIYFMLMIRFYERIPSSDTAPVTSEY